MRQTDFEDTTEVEIEDSLDDSSDVDNDISVFEDNGNAFLDVADDDLDSSSLHDNSIMNDTQ